MKLSTGKTAFLFSLLAMVLSTSGRAQQQVGPAQQQMIQQMLPKEDVEVLEFEDAEYPPVPQHLHMSGAAVVQAKLNDRGAVTDVALLSGDPRFGVAAAFNVKKWRFRPNASKSATIVYNFIYLEGRCNSNGSLFVLAPGNLATVYGCGAPPVSQ